PTARWSRITASTSTCGRSTAARTGGSSRTRRRATETRISLDYARAADAKTPAPPPIIVPAAAEVLQRSGRCCSARHFGLTSVAVGTASPAVLSTHVRERQEIGAWYFPR